MTDRQIRIYLAGSALVDRVRAALVARGHWRVALWTARLGGRLFAGRPNLCPCRVCRAAGITHPTILRMRGYVDLTRREVTP